MIKTYAKVMFPGLMFPETKTLPVENRASFICPDKAYGYTFYKREEQFSSETGRLLTSASFVHEPIQYPDAEYYTTERLKAEFPNEKILIQHGQNVMAMILSWP